MSDGASSDTCCGECTRSIGLNGLGKLMSLCATVGSAVFDEGHAAPLGNAAPDELGVYVDEH